MSDSDQNAFLELVQLHERMWGTDQYMGRPSLNDLITMPIVLMWVEVRPSQARNEKKAHTASKPADTQRTDGYFMFSVHRNVDEMGGTLMEAFFANKVTTMPHR